MATNIQFLFFVVTLAVSVSTKHFISAIPIKVDMKTNKRFYYVEALVGTPPSTFKMMLNTASNLTTVTCADCVNCGPTKTRYKSSETKNACLSCTYYRSFTDGYNNNTSPLGFLGGFSSGFMLEDIISFGDDMHGLVDIGCTTSEFGTPDVLDGILGLSLGPENIVRKATGDDSFSICFPGDAAEEGHLTLGHVIPARENVMYAAVDDLGGFYSLSLKDVRINQMSAFDSNIALGSVVVNTMWQPSFFHRDLYTLMLEGVEHEFLHFKVGNPGENCYNFQSPIFPASPTLDIVNGEGVVLSVPPSNYLLQNIGSPGEYCLDFYEMLYNNFSVLGARMFRDILVSYDKKNSRMEFSHNICSEHVEGDEKEKGIKGLKHHIVLIIVIGSILVVLLLVLAVLALMRYGMRCLRQHQEERFRAPVQHQLEAARESTQDLVGRTQVEMLPVSTFSQSESYY